MPGSGKFDCPHCSARDMTHSELSSHLQFIHPEFWDKVEKVGKKLQLLANDNMDFIMTRKKAVDLLSDEIKAKPDLGEEDAFNTLYHKHKLPVYAITHALRNHYGEPEPREPTSDEIHQYQDRQKERFNREVDRHVLRSSKLDDLKSQVKQAKIDIEHKHRIVWRANKQFRESPVLKGKVGKYAKIWLLNAKQTNGNGWGVDASTIDKNIQYFVNRPYVITAKEWIPETVYETYDHPFVPTNDIRKILSHQEAYRVGTIRKVLKENDDYYAMIEINPKFAHMSLPPFCSPAIFQVDYREPEDRLTKWIPLHLAGLRDSPAYGARIALLKGTCLGTEMECSVQLKTAKLYDDMGTSVVCPIATAQLGNKLQKLAATGIDLGEGDTGIKRAPVEPDYDDPLAPEKRMKNIRNFLTTNPQAGYSESTHIEIPEHQINKYVYEGEKTRPAKPKGRDFRSIIQARLLQIGAKIKQAQEGDIIHEIVEKATQVYNADELGYVEVPGGPRCGTCIWFEKGESECMLIKDMGVSGDDGCCDAWLNKKRAKSILDNPDDDSYEDTHGAKVLAAEESSDIEKSVDDFWDTINPSQRQHIIDPDNIIEGTRDLVQKKWDELSKEEQEKIKKQTDARYQKPNNPITIEEIVEWWNSLSVSQRQHFLDPDNLFKLESFEICEKKYSQLDKQEQQEVITTYSFRHGGADVSHLIDGDGVFRKAIYNGADKVESELRKESHPSNSVLQSEFLTRGGDSIPLPSDHVTMANKVGHYVGLGPSNDIHEFLKRTGLIRVQHFKKYQKTNYHIGSPVTVNQLKTIRDNEKSQPNGDTYIAVEKSPGEIKEFHSVRDLTSHLRENNMVKGAKEEIDQLDL